MTGSCWPGCNRVQRPAGSQRQPCWNTNHATDPVRAPVSARAPRAAFNVGVTTTSCCPCCSSAARVVARVVVLPAPAAPVTSTRAYCPANAAAAAACAGSNRTPAAAAATATCPVSASRPDTASAAPRAANRPVRSCSTAIAWAVVQARMCSASTRPGVAARQRQRRGAGPGGDVLSQPCPYRGLSDHAAAGQQLLSLTP